MALSYREVEDIIIKTFEGRRLKLGDEHPYTQESNRNIIDLHEAWNKPEKAEEWRAKLPKAETKTE